MEITAADILEQTAEKFETGEYKWFGGDVERTMGDQICADMAINKTVRMTLGGFEQNMNLARAAGGALMSHVDSYSIPRWNDTPGRTLDEVIQALKETAKELRNQS